MTIRSTCYPSDGGPGLSSYYMIDEKDPVYHFCVARIPLIVFVAGGGFFFVRLHRALRATALTRGRSHLTPERRKAAYYGCYVAVLVILVVALQGCLESIVWFD